MQAINANSSKDQNSFPVQNKSSEKDQTSVKATDDHTGTASHFPEDFVELSAPQSFTQNPSTGKKASTHVTNEEKKALFDSFSGRTGFSVYS